MYDRFRTQINLVMKGPVYIKHTSLSFDSVKHTKAESSLVSPAVMTKTAVSTFIHAGGLSEKMNRKSFCFF